MISQSRRAPANGLSHVIGDTSAPLSTKTIPRLLAAAVAAGGDGEAAVFPEQARRFSWNQLDEAVDLLAVGLLGLGLTRGQRVAIWSPNRWEWLVTQYATARIGLILVNINPAYRLYELEYALKKVGCAALITAARFKSSDYLGMLNTLAPELQGAAPGSLSAERLPDLKAVIRLGEDRTAGMLNFSEILGRGGSVDRARLDAISAALDPDDAINIQFTSGTTGAPKGATLTHANIVNNGRFVAMALTLSADDRVCIPVPFYHCFGMVLGSLACVSTASAMVFPSEGFDPGLTLKAVATERCTALYGVPTMFVAMLDHPSFAGIDFSSLRTGIMAGAPCPMEVMKRVVAAMHMGEVTIAYGMTETSPISFQSAVDDPLERRVSTIGRVQPHVEVKIVDSAGAIARTGEIGELCTRGYSVMLGYWEEPSKTNEAIDAEGWMHTGDLATIDAEGFCNIVGRLKDMLIRGGENVYPREIEEFLYRHPKVREAQVFGVPDARYGEEVCAWIVPQAGENPTEEEIRSWCQGQIAHFKVPRYIRFKTELPMTVTGKAQKFVMRDAMIDELGLIVEKTA